MRIGSFGTTATAVVLAATASAPLAMAGPVLCDDAHRHTSLPKPCVSEMISIDPLSEAAGPALKSARSDRWHSAEVNGQSPRGKHNERWVQPWYPLSSSGNWGLGSEFALDGEWAHSPIYGDLPNRNIPEPGGLALLGIGLIGLSVLRRLKRARSRMCIYDIQNIQIIDHAPIHFQKHQVRQRSHACRSRNGAAMEQLTKQSCDSYLSSSPG